MKRKGFCLILALLLLLTALPPRAVFAEGELAAVRVADSHERNAGPDRNVIASYTDPDVFRAALSQAVARCQDRIELESFALPTGTLQNIARYVYKEMPEAFHVSDLVFYYNPQTDLLTYVLVQYRMTPAEYQAAWAQVLRTAASMLAGVQGNDALSDVEKALILHDRLALFCSYDLETAEKALQESDAYHMLGALRDGLAVCEGYAKAYSYLLDQVGIRNYYCSSRLLNHGWNVLYIDGEMYHVDVTWDDQRSDILGAVTHENFLCSTDAFLATGHHKDNSYDYDLDREISSTRYDSAWWKNSSTTVVTVGGSLYFVDHAKAMLCSETDGVIRELCSVRDWWYLSSGLRWPGNYTRLTTNGRDLFYSQYDRIYRYEVETGRTSPVWKVSLLTDEGIYGLDYADGTLIAILHTSPNFKTNGNAFRRLEQVIETPIQQKGDMDGSGFVNSDDAVYLLFHTLFGQDYAIAQDGDFDKNGATDSDDAIYLLFHVLFGEVYPL